MKYPFSIIFPKRIGEISDFTLTVSEGAVMFGNRRYSLTSDNSGGFTAKYKQSGRPDEDALKTITSKQTADKLADILRENKAGRWQGFDKTNKRVCDGHGFGIDVTFTDGSRLYAHGYMRYPLGYRGLVDAVESLFETLFEME